MQVRYITFNTKGYVRLESAAYFYNNLKIKDEKFENFVNEYYSLLDKNFGQIEKDKLPCKIGEFNKSNKYIQDDYNNFVIIELFIKNIITREDMLKQILLELKLFRDEKLNMLEHSYKQNRRGVRQDIKKYFRNREKNLMIFFDNLIYIEIEFNKFKKVIEEFICHIEKYYIN